MLLFSMVAHEYAHGYAAFKQGDMTAYQLGRLTWNPVKHIDPFMTIILPVMLALIGAPIFGGAKPVPVNFNNLRRPKQDMLWVAAAGPGANLAMAIFWAFMIKIAFWMPGSGLAMPLALMGAAGVFINAILMMLNLLPLPPCSG
jgi:Zn-dependent protease